MIESFRAFPRLMAVLNVSPESFSGGVVDGETVGDIVGSAVRGGASILDIGGQSLRTDQPEISIDDEIARVVPIVAACRDAIAAIGADGPIGISIDTYRAPVAAAAIDAGATIINDASGLIDPAMAGLAAERNVEMVLAYSRATPKIRTRREDLVPDPVADGLAFLTERIDQLVAAGVPSDRLLIDPGPDLGKSPAQTVEVLCALEEFRRFGAPLLLAISRKDFIGAITRTGPLGRAAGLYGTLAALDLRPADVIRVHEPAEVRNFYLMRAVMRGEVIPDPDVALTDDLRYVTPA